MYCSIFAFYWSSSIYIKWYSFIAALFFPFSNLNHKPILRVRDCFLGLRFERNHLIDRKFKSQLFDYESFPFYCWVSSHIWFHIRLCLQDVPVQVHVCIFDFPVYVKKLLILHMLIPTSLCVYTLSANAVRYTLYVAYILSN